MQRFQYRTPKGLFRTIPEVLKAYGHKARFDSYEQLRRIVPEAVREAAPGREHLFEKLRR